MDPTYKGLPIPLPTVQPKRGPNFKLILMIAGGFLLLIVILGLIFSNGGGNSETNQRLLYRIDALITLTDSADTNIKNDDLQKISAELSLILTGDQTALKSTIAAAKYSKTLTAIKTEEADAASNEKLKTAATNGTYDATYKAVLLEKLSSTYSLANDVSSANSGKKLKAALATLQSHLTTYFDQLK